MNRPNWKLVPCPTCHAAAGENCVRCPGRRHNERQRLADRTVGLKLSIPKRKRVAKAKRYWSNACRDGHPELCSGVRKARNGERGSKRCENPVHDRLPDVTLVAIAPPTLQA